MMKSLRVRNFRGIERLDVEDLGRVNLIVGRNEVGKTTVMGAASLRSGPDAWGLVLPLLLDPVAAAITLERTLLPMFRNGDPTVPILVEWEEHGRTDGWRVELARGQRSGWQLPLRFNATSTPARVVEATMNEADDALLFSEVGDPGIWWSPPCVEEERQVVDSVEKLYLRASLEPVLRGIREINPRVTALEPVGAHLYVRLEGTPLPLPYKVLGDGARRALEFAIALGEDQPLVFVDEVENGFHWSALPGVFRMFSSAASATQVFLTTHRDEAVRAAAEVFIERGDDSLRVIRLDRREDGHHAVVYTAEMALAAMDSGLEIRG